MEFLLINVIPSKRGLHEILTGTLTVNDAESSYFASKKEYDEYASKEAIEAKEEEAPEQEVVQEVAEEAAPSIDPVVIEEKKEESPVEESAQGKTEFVAAPSNEGKGEVHEELLEDEDAFLDENKK